MILRVASPIDDEKSVSIRRRADEYSSLDDSHSYSLYVNLAAIEVRLQLPCDLPLNLPVQSSCQFFHVLLFSVDQ